MSGSSARPAVSDVKARLRSEVLDGRHPHLIEPPPVVSVDELVSKYCRRAAIKLVGSNSTDPDQLASAAERIAGKLIGEIERTLGTMATDVRRPDLLEEMHQLLELLGEERMVRFARSLANRHEADDLLQEAHLRIRRRFENAERNGEPGQVARESPTGYVKTIVRNLVIDRLSRHQEQPSERVGELVDRRSSSAGGESGTEADGEAELARLAARLREQSHQGPAMLGRAYGDQWLTAGPKAKAAMARRFEIALLFTAWQRRSPDVVAPAMIDGLQTPIEEDDASWLRDPANEALSLLVEGWAARYYERLPSASGGPPGVRGTKESGDYDFLLRECQGRTDERRVDDAFGDLSTRRYGAGALVRHVYQRTVDREIGAGRA